jgi:hypothetical protein
MNTRVLVCALALTGLSAATLALAHGPGSPADNWLLNERDADKRTEMIQEQFGGFGTAMREVGERWNSIHAALERNNLELAVHHWEELHEAMEHGVVRRPGRKASADAFFFNSLYDDVKRDFESGDSERAWRGFEKGRESCMACHVAEQMPFLNDQAMFDRRTPGAE